MLYTNWLYRRTFYFLGVLHFLKAKWGEPSVPVIPLMTAVEKAVSGAPSETPRVRLYVGPFPGYPKDWTDRKT